jgi:hypothetical protein
MYASVYITNIRVKDKECPSLVGRVKDKECPSLVGQRHHGPQQKFKLIEDPKKQNQEE